MFKMISFYVDDLGDAKMDPADASSFLLYEKSRHSESAREYNENVRENEITMELGGK